MDAEVQPHRAERKAEGKGRQDAANAAERVTYFPKPRRHIIFLRIHNDTAFGIKLDSDWVFVGMRVFCLHGDRKEWRMA